MESQYMESNQLMRYDFSALVIERSHAKANVHPEHNTMRTLADAYFISVYKLKYY